MTTLDSWYCRRETVIYPYKNTYSRFSFPINTIYLQKAIRVNILSHTHFHVYRKVWQNLHVNFTCKVNFVLSSTSGQHDQLLKAQLQHQPRAPTGGHPKPVAAVVTLGHLCTQPSRPGSQGAKAGVIMLTTASKSHWKDFASCLEDFVFGVFRSLVAKEERIHQGTEPRLY